MKKIILFILLVSQIGITGCQVNNKVKSTPIEKSYYSRISVDKGVNSDPEIENFINPYKQQLNAEMSRVIGFAEYDMPSTRKYSETLLGNLVSDVVFETAKAFMNVDCAIINAGGLRASIFKGDIKVENIFQLMPFENKIVVVKYSGKQLKSIIEEIVHDNGVPVSGITIVANSGVIEAFIEGKKINEQGDYYVASIDYVANGGGGVKSMWVGKIFKDTNVLLREAIIKYVTDKKTIAPKIEGRVVIQ